MAVRAEPAPGAGSGAWRRWRYQRAAAAVLVLAAVLLCLLLLEPAGPPAPAWVAPAGAAPPADGPVTPLEPAATLDPRKVALGEALFHDPRLSGGGAIACATCHDLRTNGARAGPRTTRLDAPTVFNAALNFRFGWEGRHRSLEAQALATLANPMMAQGLPLDRIVARLGADPATRRSFHAVYGRDPDAASVADAIAAFERTLVTTGSRFDRWLGGDRAAITPREARGYALFRKLGCASCHQGRNVGGNLYQRHGIFHPLAAPEPAVVRVPSLRNVAATAPYFHDGSAATLEAAIRRMANSQLNRRLTDAEVDLVAAYLRTLTGNYRGRPLRAPR